MPEHPEEPVEIFRSRGLPEAHAIRGMLESENIPVQIDNEMLQGAVGELPLGWTTSPRILVDPAFEAKARALLDAFLEKVQADDAEPDQDRPLKCLACGAEMGDADVCPKCGWSYEDEDGDSEPKA